MRERAGRNRTIALSDSEVERFKKKLVTLHQKAVFGEIVNKTIFQNAFDALEYLPDRFIDLVFVDPPYNLNKKFNSTSFQELEAEEYESWLETWVPKVVRMLKPTASFYICGDWKSSGAIHYVVKKYFTVRNRITFEREKGRGAKTNWKNCSEDIWYCTLTNDYHFDVDAVKMKRRVIAPYKDQNGKPKDWEETEDGKYRITHPSNMWTDITIPFWSMPENTDHPTQKP